MPLAKRPNTFYRYFPVAKRDRNWGLFVTTTGASQFGPNTSYPGVGHPKKYATVTVGRSLPEFQIIYVSAGRGWLKIAGGPKRKIEAGQVIMLFPGVRHSYSPTKATGWSEHWVGFDGDLARRLMRRGFFAPSQPVLRAGDEERLLALFNDLIRVSHENHPASQQILAGITMNILALLYSVQQFGPIGREPGLKVIQEAIVRMRESAEKPLDLPALAAQLNVSYRHFRRAFAQHTGLSPYKYLMEIRLAHARNLLAQTSLPLKEIALRTGFDDSQYFCRFFHKKIGLAPGTWRSHAKKGNIR